MISSGDMTEPVTHNTTSLPFPTVFSVLLCLDFNIVMAKDGVGWGRGQWNKSIIHSFLTTSLSLSNIHLVPEYEALPALAGLKVMKRACDGKLETSLLALCLQKLSQFIFFPKELQTCTGSAGSFQVPRMSSSAQLRSEVDRWDSAHCFSILENMSHFPTPHCCQILLGSQPLPGCNLDTTKCKAQNLLPGQSPGGPDTLT